MTSTTSRAVTIREAGIADAAAITTFATKIFLATFGPGTEPANDPADLDAYLSEAFTVPRQEAELTDPRCVYLLAESGNAVAGFALVRIGSTDPAVTSAAPVEIQRFYVDGAFHGTGLAAQLMARVHQVARERGGETIWLGVWEHNPRAIRFYEKHGFRDVGSHPFLLGQDLQTDRVMQRSVAA